MVARSFHHCPALIVLAIMAAQRPGWAQAAERVSDDMNVSVKQEPERHPLYPMGIGTPDPLATRLCGALHTLSETRKAQCCGTPLSSSMAAECVRTLSAALHDGAVSLVAEEIEGCVEATTKQLTGCDWVTPLTPPTPPACANLVHGQLHGGARCRSSLECKDGLFCRGVGPTTAGLCTDPVPVGTACGQGQDPLALYTRQTDTAARHPDCAGACRAGQCTAVVALGGECTARTPCAVGTYCVSGRCVASAFARIREMCGGDKCVDGAACVRGRCVALKAAGEPCTFPFECQAGCVKRPGAAVGTCGMQCDALFAAPSTATTQSNDSGRN